MKFRLIAGVASLALLAGAAIPALGGGGTQAAQPANPGCFGQDRAQIIQETFLADDAPGASNWGAIAAERGSTNGEQNRAYMTFCGGDPSTGNEAE